MAQNPNELQRLASDPTVSAWVGASAGSGKTKVLSDRVMRLLLTGTEPAKILCLTFTRTAAAEMANRVSGRLAKWASESENDLKAELKELTGKDPDKKTVDKARRLFAAFLDTPGGLKITTVHSFCQSLLKRFPAEAGVSPQFDVLDELHAKELIAQARDEVITDPRYAKDLETISPLLTENGLSELLKELSSHGEDMKRMQTLFQGNDDLLTAAYEKTLELPAGSTPESIVRDFCRLSDERKKDLNNAAEVLEKSSSSWNTDKVPALRRFLSAAEPDRLKVLEDYFNVFLTDGRPKTNKWLACGDAKSVLNTMREEAERAMPLKEPWEKAKSLRISLALFRIGSAISDKYVKLKNAHSVMDYDDLIVKTKNLLDVTKKAAAAWVLFKLDGGIDHILVDEAQDTSPDQWEIVQALADEFFAGEGARSDNRTLFVVGDEKQSIFSFQGAVPEKFDDMNKHFKQKVEASNRKWKNVPMNTSFRSMPAVIEAVNLLLKQKQEQKPMLKGVIEEGKDYDGKDYPEHVAFHRQAGLVELWPLIPYRGKEAEDENTLFDGKYASTDTASSILADKIATKIKEMIDGKEFLACKNRPVQAGDIMILVQKRNELHKDIAKKLNVRRIPVAGIDRLKITEDIAVKDLMSLGDVLLLPEDDLSLATVLRSPLCGISDDDLFKLAYGRGNATLFDRLKTYKDKPETPLGKAYDFIDDLLSNVDKMRPYELYSYVLGPKGKQKEFVSRMNDQVTDVLNEFLNMALEHDRTQPPSLQNFLNDLRANDVEIKRDPDQAGDTVRIMTVHAAKGLQAPVVFLPQTRPDNAAFNIKEKTYWIKKDEKDKNEIPLLFWAPSADWKTDLIKNKETQIKEKEWREYNRLLYVGMTRAEEKLYVCGFNTDDPANGSWYESVRTALESAMNDPAETNDFSFDKITKESPFDGPYFQDDPVLRLTYKNPEPLKEEEKKEQQTEAGQAPLPEWFGKNAAPESSPSKPLAPSHPDAEEPAHLSPLTEGRSEAIKRGNVIHSLLEILPRYAGKDRMGIALKLVETQMPEADQDKRNKLIASVLNLMEAPMVADLFSGDSLAEVPVTGKINDRPISGKIDRLVVRDTEVLLIDYKTGKKIPDSAEKTPVAYLKQMAAYKNLMTKIYPDKTVRCFLLWTEAPLLTDITSVVYDTSEY